MSGRLAWLRRTFLPLPYIVMVAALLVSTVVMAIVPTDASALPKTANEKVNSYYYYSVVASCLDGLEEIKDPNEVVTGPVKTRANDTRQVGYVASSTGSLTCSAIITHAINVWGYGSREEAFKDWGYVLKNDQYIHSGDVGDSIQSAVRKRVYSGKAPSLTPDLQYVNASAALTAVCGVNLSSGISPTDLTEGQKATYNNTAKYLRITVPGEGTPPTPTEKYFAYTPKKKTQIDAEVAAGDYTQECRDWAGVLTKNVAAFMSSEAYKENPTGSGNPGDTTAEEDAQTDCAAQGGFGWLICSAIRNVASFVGAMYELMTFFLEVPTLSTDSSSGLFQAWSNMRNIANVIFVGIFILVIYSQIIGGGGGKKK